MRLFYQCIAYLALPFLFLRLYWRSRKTPQRWERWQERCGYTPLLKECLWIHAVSLGEAIAAIPLIKKIISHYPQIPVLVTSMTLTGAEHMRQQLGNTVYTSYIPFDAWHLVQRFFQRSHPKLAIILETEFWPNLCLACTQRRIPMIITNARLSPSSAERYQRYCPRLIRWMLAGVSQIACQAPADGERFVRLGLHREKLNITGNIKFDVTVSDKQREAGARLRQEIGATRLVWVAASTHDGEEKLMLAAHRELLKYYPGAGLILVPRHPERFDSIAALLRSDDWCFARRSLNEPITLKTQIYLADTVGEMMMLFAAGDIAVVAGSFKPIGGHNVLEPAALGKPVVSGPVVHNFLHAVALLKAAEAIDIVENSAESLAEALCELAGNATLRHEKGQRALAVILSNRGALDKQFSLIARAVSRAFLC